MNIDLAAQHAQTATQVAATVKGLAPPDGSTISTVSFTITDMLGGALRIIVDAECEPWTPEGKSFINPPDFSINASPSIEIGDYPFDGLEESPDGTMSITLTIAPGDERTVDLDSNDDLPIALLAYLGLIVGGDVVDQEVSARIAANANGLFVVLNHADGSHQTVTKRDA